MPNPSSTPGSSDLPERHALSKTALVLVAPPPVLSARARALVKDIAQSRRATRSLALVVLVSLGLGLGAAVAQWRYGQPLSEPTLSSEPGTYIAGMGQFKAKRSRESVAAANPAPPQLTPSFAPNHITALNADALQSPPTATLNAVGDVIPGTNYRTYRLPQDRQYLFGGIAYPHRKPG